MLALWLLSGAVGVYLARAHRREFLAAVGIAPTRAALGSDSALGAMVREVVTARMPLGSDTLAVQAFARGLGTSAHLVRIAGRMGPTGAGPYHLWVKFPERMRWYELGLCDWDRVLDFALDSARTVRDVRVERVGTCP